MIYQNDNEAYVNEDISRKIIEIVAKKLRVKPNNIKLTSSFIEDLGADSLGVVELVVAVEEEFSVEISDQRAEKMILVEDLVIFLKRQCLK